MCFESLIAFSGGTRTCIHTPSEPMDAEELQPLYEEILANAAVVYFDGRLTEAAVPVARAARNAGSLMLTEILVFAWNTFPIAVT